jgi:hypothetical protein
MAPKVDDQTLPNKEQALFRALVKQYEVRDGIAPNAAGIASASSGMPAG